MKHIKLYETWQWLNQEPDKDDREYSCTVGDLLDWAIGPDWLEDQDWMVDSLLIGDEPVDESDAIGYHELFKRASDQQIEVDSQQLGGQIDNSWQLGDLYFSLITDDWPFTDDSDNLTQAEEAIVVQIHQALKTDPIMQLASIVDIIDFVQLQTRGQGLDPKNLSATSFKNWYSLQRIGSN